MDYAQYILLGTVIAGAAQLIAHLRAKDLWGATTILSAASIGALFGFFGVEGLDLVSGAATGLGVSGAVTVAGKLSASNTATVTPNTTATN